ncbi:type 2 lanthipeptide synthetase LanM family protein [Kitasatospora sp. NBC_01287]|uniref:type 2 lanthipeptide synthetase LanM family protein n=1 Tax=Kitasatospora sp. NBC_01287 TaxID=2903573 RepID=UPI0022554554|nr:type 2 lanthipeptide synthetase LanM family protein [Kitasatospora sp. NBC_01287]MCX4745783.1 type 2 lanthipeptide synthetase LanM family protein [Kitasatospora sp. NBC_01287]
MPQEAGTEVGTETAAAAGAGAAAELTAAAEPVAEGWFAEPVRALAAPLLAESDRELAALAGLAVTERQVLGEALGAALARSLQLKLNRVFLLELRAAALAGELAGADERARWRSFIRRAVTGDYLDGLRGRYPGLPERVTAAARLQLDAGLTLARRLVRDRAAIGALLGGPPGALLEVELGVGDQHRGGHAVARVRFAGGTVMYKPRPLEVDAVLRVFLAAVLPDGTAAPIRVPEVLAMVGTGAPADRAADRATGAAAAGDHYGWAAHVEHAYCRDEDELALFYRNLGHWLAVMRLLGGTDLHAENLLAHGPVPVVVDAESLFTPDPETGPSGRGDAVDLAARTVRTTVLRTGILPLRIDGYALAGVDFSAAGGLPGQQPLIPMPVIVDGGRDTARMELTAVEFRSARNHPSPAPVLSRHWQQVLHGFAELTDRLRRLDEKGELRSALAGFDGCEVRLIRRPTQTYMEIGRMLWHPASLHDPAGALVRARDILARNAAGSPIAPREAAVIEAEIADLLLGDVPVFGGPVDPAALDAALCDWRGADLPLEQEVIRGALVGAYLNERQLPARTQKPATAPDARRAEERRRRLAAVAVRTICAAAVRGRDGTATWISPVLTEVGWAVRPLTADLYSGQGGVLFALAQYRQEQAAGHADPVEGLEEVLRGGLRVLAATEEQAPVRQIGGFTGLASQVWTWSALHELLGEEWLLERAQVRAGLLDGERVAADRALDVLGGAAGAVVPLLGLAEATGVARWLDGAALAGRHLERTAVLDERGAHWSTALFPAAMGGFAHGATGMGWALARLALSPAGSPADRVRWCELSARAMDFERSLYLPSAGAWADLRETSGVDHATAWCHGSTGIGLAAADLYRRTGEPAHLETARRAGSATLREGFGWTHTLCHGDLGLWELLAALRDCRPAAAPPRGGERGRADAELLSGLEEHGAIGGLAREAFSPGLMPGLAGVLNLLLRMRPGHRLASPLLLGRAGDGAARGPVATG